jgi:hypothetical protein
MDGFLLQSSAVSRPTIQTLETIKAGEKIMEAIEVADRELQILKDYQHEFQVCYHHSLIFKIFVRLTSFSQLT